MLLGGIIVGLIALVVLVVVHELGHAIVARRNGVVVEEFGVGFPPVAWQKKLRNKILLKLNWLPLGGYVKLQGEYDSANKEGDYGNASYWAKTKILMAGVLVNWIVAVVLLSIVALFGMPKVLPDQFFVASDMSTGDSYVTIAAIESDMPASIAGMEIGDKIVSVDGRNIKDVEEFIDLLKQDQNQSIDIAYIRSGSNIQHVDVQLGSETEKGIFGAGLGISETVKSTWSAPIVGFGTTVQFTVLTFQSLGDMAVNFVTGVVDQVSFDQNTRQEAAEHLSSASENVAGPIGLLGTIFPAAYSGGIVHILFLSGVISLSLAVMNALPIPALDGGRWLLMTVYRLRKKILTKEKEEQTQMIGFYVIMGLTLLVTFIDVAKIL